MPYIYTLKNPAYREPKGNAIPFKQWQRENAPVVSVLNPPSRVKSKKDKHAVQMHRIHATPFKALPDYAMRNAGHCNRFNGKVESERQFV